MPTAHANPNRANLKSTALALVLALPLLAVPAFAAPDLSAPTLDHGYHLLYSLKFNEAQQEVAATFARFWKRWTMLTCND